MSSSNKKVIFAALIGNLGIAIIKFIGAFLTKSSAMFSEGIHSLVDTGNQILLLYGLKQAQKPANSKFPFGYGKEVYFWSFCVAILIFALGAGFSIKEGIHQINNPSELKSFTVSYTILFSAIIFECVPWVLAFKEFKRVKGERGYFEAVRRGKDPALFLVLFEDSAAILGLIIAILGLHLTEVTGNVLFDGIASILIGILLGVVAAWLAYETKGLLIGESADKEVVLGIHKIASNYKSIERLNEVLTMHMGPNYILVNLSIEFNDHLKVESMENLISLIDKDIKTMFPNVKRVFIEAESKL